MNNTEADYRLTESRLMARPIRDAYPDVAAITIKIDSTNGDKGHSLDEWRYTPEHVDFFMRGCPFAECYGPDSGIDFKPVISDMILKRESSRAVTFRCGGKGDRSLRHCCDWFIKATVSIDYR